MIHCVEGCNHGLGILADLITYIYLTCHSHIALVTVLVHNPVLWSITCNSDIYLKHTLYAKVVGEVYILRMLADRRTWTYGKLYLVIVVADIVHRLIDCHPCRQAWNLVVLWGSSWIEYQFLPWIWFIPLLGNIRDGNARTAPANAGEIGMEHPRYRFWVIAVLILDIVNGRYKVVIIHKR